MLCFQYITRISSVATASRLPRRALCCSPIAAGWRNGEVVTATLTNPEAPEMCTRDRAPTGERELVAEIGEILRRRWPGAFTGSVPFGDDLAPLLPRGAGPLAWTTDAIMDGVDFDSREHNWNSIGRKALAVNLSDCAAMAGRPIAALVNLILNRRITSEKSLDMMRGAIDLAAEFECPIVGGDVNSWDAPTAIAITIAAETWPGAPFVRRDRMCPGDVLFLTGPLGGSILGRHLTFQPRINVARQLAEALHPTAMIDISDGLAIDLARMAEASGCGVALDPALFDAVIHDDARRLATTSGRSPRDHALHDGEDFELIVAVRPESLCTATADLVAPLLRIGVAEPGRGVSWKGSDSRREAIEPRGWEHTLDG